MTENHFTDGYDRRVLALFNVAFALLCDDNNDYVGILTFKGRPIGYMNFKTIEKYCLVIEKDEEIAGFECHDLLTYKVPDDLPPKIKI